MLKKLILLLVVYSLFLDAFSKDFVLFKAPGIPVEGYNDLILQIKAGDSITFSNDKRYMVDSVLGNGNTTRIFGVGNKGALRVAMHDEDLVYIDEFWKGYVALRDHGVPVPRVYFSRAGEFVLVERYQKIFSLHEFEESKFSLGEGTYGNALGALRTFVLLSKKFSELHDGSDNKENIVYTKSGWLFVDWREKAFFAKSFRDKHVLHSIEKVLKMKKKIQEARKDDQEFVYTKKTAKTLASFYADLDISSLRSVPVYNGTLSYSRFRGWLPKFKAKFDHLCGFLNQRLGS